MCSRAPRRFKQGWMTRHCTLWDVQLLQEQSRTTLPEVKNNLLSWYPRASWTMLMQAVLIPSLNTGTQCHLRCLSAATVPKGYRFLYLPAPCRYCQMQHSISNGTWCIHVDKWYIPLCHWREDNSPHQLLQTGSLWWQELHHGHVCCYLLGIRRLWWAQIQILMRCTSSPDQIRNTPSNTVPHIAEVSWEILFLLYKTKNGYFCMAGLKFNILNHKKVVNTFQSAECFLNSKK